MRARDKIMYIIAGTFIIGMIEIIRMLEIILNVIRQLAAMRPH